jgi:acyl-CoA reductase-like NAD-dependent aldehyde dehydrogenase
MSATPYRAPRLLIDGEWRRGRSGQVVTIHARLGERLALLEREQRGDVLGAFANTDRGPLRIHAVSERLEVGSLAVNGIGVSVPEAPFGRVKDSGHGSESGTEGMEAFLDSKFMHYTA